MYLQITKIMNWKRCADGTLYLFGMFKTVFEIKEMTLQCVSLNFIVPFRRVAAKLEKKLVPKALIKIL